MEQRSTSLRASQKPKLLARDISESLGKLPPQACDLEEAVLGALMLEKNALIQVVSFLKPNHFYLEAHKVVYESILDLFGAANKVDMKTVVSQLRKNGKLELIGGAYKIAELTSKVSSAANVEFHGRLIIEYSLKRSLIEVASQIHHDAYDDTVDVFDLYNKSNLQMQEILDGAIQDRAEKSAKDIAVDVLNDVSGRMTGQHLGLNCGYEAVDKLLNGLNKTDLIIVAARPGIGKSCWALQVGKYVADNGKAVGVFSLEMSSMQIIERLAIAACEVSSEAVKKGTLDNSQYERLKTALGDIYKIPMYLDDTPFMTVVELRARAMRMKAKYGIELLIVDYLQLIKGIEGRFGTRDQEIGLITRTLKGIAKELDIPVIALSQLSREAEKRGKGGRPQLSDLREGGAIEADADIVIFLYRPEYYKIQTDDDGFSTHGLCETIVAKHRNGALDTVKQKFVGWCTKFMPWNDPGATVPFSRMDQGEYVKKHYKDPTQKLPSATEEKEFNSEDLPF